MNAANHPLQMTGPAFGSVVSKALQARQLSGTFGMP
jgi:hypothetical protein